MKYSFLLALIAVATTEAASIEQQSAQRYTYEDIREQELKCKADRNREWKYDAATNTWACPLQRYDWGSSGSAQNWPCRASRGMINFINHPPRLTSIGLGPESLPALRYGYLNLPSSSGRPAVVSCSVQEVVLPKYLRFIINVCRY